MKRPEIYLQHILECVEQIEAYTSGDADKYLESSLVQDAVLRRLHTLAESTQRLPSELKDGYPQVPWREISGFRNVVVHDYLGVDHQQIWRIVENDLPDLANVIRMILASDDGA